jgi:diguanylate cyclase (GGDEF)-like protein
MRFGDLPRVARLYVASICGLAVVQAALAAWQPSAQAPLERFALLVLAATIAHSFPVSTPGKQSYHVSLPFFITAIILLAPLQFVALVVLVHIVEQVRQRRSAFAQIFNTAAYVVTGLVAQAAYRALWPAQAELTADLSQPACLAAGLAAAIVFALLNRVLVSMAIWLGNRISPRDQHMFEGEALLTDAVLLLMGLPLAHLTVVAPWAAAVGAAPLWLIHRVLDLPNMRDQRRQDGLTELFTAPYLTETCTRELNRGGRFNRPVSLILLDMDGLGELNAAHGHQAGDAVLRATARTIKRATREYDLPARLAGGLFAVLLPETDLAAAQVVAERIRRTTAERRHEVPNSVEQARLTVSIGGAVHVGGVATAAELFEAAQAALARAKSDGGNRIDFATIHGVTLAPAPSDAAAQAVDEPLAGIPSPVRTVVPAAQPVAATWIRRAVIGGVGGLLLAVFLVQSEALLDWRLLVVMTGLAALAGLAFYFKPLTVALALAVELHRSPARLWAARYWRLWPQYLALCTAGALVVYAYHRFGLAGATTMAAAALMFRHLAGQYVDRTLESVRKLRTATEQLEHRAFHDPLTSLANRALFAERLEHAMVRAGPGSVAVLFLDLDNFKTVNDTLGHAAGDALLIAAAERLLQCVRREDTIARLGGDEFTVLLEDMHDPSDAARMAERIGEALRTPFELAGQSVTISSSIGIALDTDRSHGPDDLMREADMAMYRAKSGGKARYEIFDTGMGSRAVERLELETELRHAVQRGELVLHYQPVVSLSTGQAEAVEALLRWQHPRRGLLVAAEFLPMAIETGTMVELGNWALQQACADAANWQHLRPGLGVQVNVAPRELEQPALAASVAAALSATGLPPAYLRLEIPETTLAQEGESTATVLEELSALGVRLALDDVAGGVSSLGLLARLPVDVLKISPSAADSPTLIRATVALAAALGMTVTAQAVAGVDQSSRLAALGCSHAQGPLFGKPITADCVPELFSSLETAQLAA